MPDIFICFDSSDEYWRARFEDLFAREFACRSVRHDAVPDKWAIYCHDLRELGYLTPETVMVVLVGPRAYSSKKVDWEVAAALDDHAAHPTGLIAMRLPTHEDYKKRSVNPRRIPHRIADNLRSGYLRLYDWTESARELESRLYAAHKAAQDRSHLVKNAREVMQRDLFR